VALAIDVINNEASDPYIRDWAVDLFDQNSPIKIPPNVVQNLKDGDPLLVPEGVVAFTSYMVQEGDTLDSIRQRFITTTSLMARHEISAESVVPGNVLRVPIIIPLTACGPLSPYVVQANDTYAELAEKFAITEELLRRINNAGADEQLYSNVFICVPRL
jgi:LysM repeat protein